MKLCKKYLGKFEPTESPPWRRRLNSQDRNVPSISEMIRDIVQCKEVEQGLLNNISMENLKKVKRSLLLTFIVNVQKEEDIGVKDRGTTEILMDTIDNDPANVPSVSLTLFRKASLQDEASQCPTTLRSDSLEDEITQCFQNYKQPKPHKNELETVNLYKAYKKLLKNIDCKDPDYGLLDVDHCVSQIHKCLMQDVVERPGVFSLNDRMASYNGKVHQYPRFATKEVAQAAMQHVVDRYNDMITELKHNENLDEVTLLLLLFKCASLLLFSLVSLHPFPDGNGRLCRLLTSYCLSIYSPFLTPIYNVFSSSVETDYVQALVDTRSVINQLENIDSVNDAAAAAELYLSGRPEDLCAMLVESNWTMWRSYLGKLGANVNFREWEKQNMLLSEG